MNALQTLSITKTFTPVDHGELAGVARQACEASTPRYHLRKLGRPTSRKSHQRPSIALAALLVCTTGCARSDADVSKTTPNADEIAQIQEYLEPFVSRKSWIGDRIRVTGTSGDFPKTESIGSWEITVSQTDTEGIFDLQGVRIGKPRAVELDTNRGMLFIDGAPYVGRALTGHSPVAEGAHFKGAVFECNQVSMNGSASILVLEDGRLLLDFYKVRTGDSRGEYGFLSPKKAEKGR